MTDIFSKKKRSNLMSNIRSANTKPELIVRKFLFNKGYRYRLHDKNLPGSFMGLCKVNRPGFLIYGGSMPSTNYNGLHNGHNASHSAYGDIIKVYKDVIFSFFKGS